MGFLPQSGRLRSAVGITRTVDVTARAGLDHVLQTSPLGLVGIDVAQALPHFPSSLVCSNEASLLLLSQTAPRSLVGIGDCPFLTYESGKGRCNWTRFGNLRT
jgi:hypothetical protein